MRLELSHVTAGYGDTVALRDVSLIIPTGTVVAVLGANGAGKTTLLRVASGLLPCRSGRLLLDDAEITSAPPAEFAQRGVCHVTEGRSVFPTLTVAENLRMFARPGDKDETFSRAVQAFPKLAQRRHQLAGTMSGGEQQMLALARAYLSGSPIVMLDEVSMGLAPIIVNEIFEFLDALVSEGRSLLIVEQYVAKALAVADLVYILARGRVAFCGEPSEVSGSELARRYLGAEAV